MVGRLLSQRRLPLYRVRDGEPQRLAEALEAGFRPTGVRSITAGAVLPDPGGN
jgi:hypothetical protein